jgi:protein phosphatase
MENVMDIDMGPEEIEINEEEVAFNEHPYPWGPDNKKVNETEQDGLGRGTKSKSNDDGCFILQKGKISACSITGPRENNEDSISYEYTDGFHILAIADGVGGLPFGEVASKLATQNFVRAAKKLFSMKTDPIEVIVRATHSANRSISNVAKALPDSHSQMCCTFIGAIIQGSTAYIVHIGDSRAYLVDRAKLTIDQLTLDHNLFEDMRHTTGVKAVHIESGNVYDDLDILDIDLAHEYNLLWDKDAEPIWGGALGRVMGDNVIQPEYQVITVNANAILLLCTDGVSNAIPIQDIGTAAVSCKPANGIADEIVAKVYARKPVDNTSVIAYCATPLPYVESEEKK